MTYLSIFEKIKVLCDIFLDYKVVLAFTLLLLIFTILYSIKKLDSKKYIILMLISLVLAFSISIISNYSVLTNTFDNFSTIFFRNIYFPSIYVYIGILVITFIVFITSIFNMMMKKVYKVINTSMFIINNILFVIILNIIAQSKVDIFSVNSLYTNTRLVTVLEISMSLCVVWVIALIVSYTTDCICDRISYRKIYNKSSSKIVTDMEKNINNDLELDTNMELLNQEFVSPSNDEYTDVSDISDNEEKSYVNAMENINNDNGISENNISFNDILNGNIPVTYYDNDIVSNEYELIDPEKIYEEKYNSSKESDTLSLNDLVSDKENIISYSNDLINDNESTANYGNDLISDKENKTNYSTEDYKMAIKMLNELKIYSNKANISVDDVVALSLVNNYSIDDCLKLKNILESNLN